MNDPQSTDDDLPDMVGKLSHCAREVDRAFNTVAERLGDGLALFEGLKSSFGDLSGELAGEDMSTTREMLTRLAKELRAFGDALPAETEMLLRMSNSDSTTTEAFAQLREHLQLVAILARSTRIEAASLTSYRDDISSFTEKIMMLIGQARASIDDSLITYSRLTAMLGAALTQQREFSNRYRGSLEAVAGKLAGSVAVIGERAARSAVFTTEAEERARQLSMAVGGAIVSMQSGDNVRQRLEHVVAALDLIAAKSQGGPDADAIAFVIKRLQTLQLRQANELLRGEVHGIDSTLALLERDSQAMVDLARRLHSGDGASPTSFLDGLHADLADASELIEKCGDARRVVDQATQALASMVDLSRQTEAGLSETIQDIVMIGTNAGLLAGRLGLSGRGLVVIANEVKSVASLIVRDARLLGPLFERLQKSSKELQARDRGEAGDMGSLDKSIRQALERMQGSGMRLETALERLATDSGNFGGIVGDCRRTFADVSASSDFVETASEQLNRETAALEFQAPADPTGLESLLAQRVFPSYTMSEERDVHHRVLQELGIDCSEPQRERSEAAA